MKPVLLAKSHLLQSETSSVLPCKHLLSVGSACETHSFCGSELPLLGLNALFTSITNRSGSSLQHSGLALSCLRVPFTLQYDLRSSFLPEPPATMKSV